MFTDSGQEQTAATMAIDEARNNGDIAERDANGRFVPGNTECRKRRRKRSEAAAILNGYGRGSLLVIAAIATNDAEKLPEGYKYDADLQLKAAIHVTEILYGKPMQAVEHSGAEGKDLNFTVVLTTKPDDGTPS
jgi:hypothetical protein